MNLILFAKATYLHVFKKKKTQQNMQGKYRLQKLIVWIYSSICELSFKVTFIFIIQYTDINSIAHIR